PPDHVVIVLRACFGYTESFEGAGREMTAGRERTQLARLPRLVRPAFLPRLVRPAFLPRLTRPTRLSPLTRLPLPARQAHPAPPRGAWAALRARSGVAECGGRMTRSPAPPRRLPRARAGGGPGPPLPRPCPPPQSPH